MWPQIKEMIESVFSRSLERSEPHSLGLTMAAILLSLGIVALPQLWRPMRNTVTLVHEFGHAFTGILMGRKLSGIRLHQDTSGDTTTMGSKGLFGWLGAKITAFFGYPFPGVIGLALAWSIGQNHPRLVLSIIFVILLVILLFVRNLQGLGVVLVHLIGLWVLVYFVPDQILMAFLAFLVGFLTFGGLKSIFELMEHHRNGDREGSDVAYLAFSLKPIEHLFFGIFLILCLSMGVGCLYFLGGF